MKVIFLYLGELFFHIIFSFFIFFSNERPKDIKIERKEEEKIGNSIQINVL